MKEISIIVNILNWSSHLPFFLFCLSRAVVHVFRNLKKTRKNWKKPIKTYVIKWDRWFRTRIRINKKHLTGDLVESRKRKTVFSGDSVYRCYHLAFPIKETEIEYLNLLSTSIMLSKWICSINRNSLIAQLSNVHLTLVGCNVEAWIMYFSIAFCRHYVEVLSTYFCYIWILFSFALYPKGKMKL